MSFFVFLVICEQVRHELWTR